MVPARENTRQSQAKAIVFVLLLCLMPHGPGSTVQTTSGAGVAALSYFVTPTGSDLNGGSYERPWATMQHAANVAPAGATVHVAPGIYMQDQLTFSNSGTATARIRFVSDQKWHAKIFSNSAYAVVSLKGSYLDLVDFEVAGDAHTCLGVVNWGSNNRIVGNHVHGVPVPTAVCKQNGGAGIDNANYDGSNSDVIGNVVHDIGSWPDEDDRAQGIYHSNYGGHIWNNLVFRCAGFGIALLHAPSHTVVANNTVFNNAYGGIYVAENSGGTAVAVVNNIVVHNRGWGIVEPSGSTPPNADNRYQKNIIFDNPGHGDFHVNPGATVFGNVLADPQFVRYTGNCDGDYSLSASSPARGQGDETYAPPNDINGAIRQGSPTDIGAYAYSPADTQTDVISSSCGTT